MVVRRASSKIVTMETAHADALGAEKAFKVDVYKNMAVKTLNSNGQTTINQTTSLRIAMLPTSISLANAKLIIGPGLKSIER